MKIRIIALAVGVLAVCAGQAQAQELLPIQTPAGPAVIKPDQLHEPDPFAEARPAGSRLYGANVAAQPNDHVFKGFRRDPRLIVGVKVAPNVALEAGYVNLPDRGLYREEQGRAEDASQGLGEKGASNHLAVKVTTPEDARLSAYAKAGIAYSEVKRSINAASDTGLYTGAGAKLKLDKSTSVNAEFSRHGNAANKLGRVIQDGIKGNMQMGF
ncbi:outer membrane beta-barrel protein [Massilia aurea]|uniref:outer membrane beta-barrel protein n=1 Tax=Massilia aurea TaxID=373040 RepID=UPI0034629AAE